jgi:hypothetical protein
MSTGLECSDLDIGVLCESLDDVPSLLLAVEMKERITAKSNAPSRLPEAAGDFLFDLHHAHVAFGLIVGEGPIRIGEEAQDVRPAAGETQEKIVSGSTRLAASPFVALGSSSGRSGAWASWRASPSATKAS